MPVEQGHEEVQELLGAYALNAVSDEEVSQVENHLTKCVECREEIGQHLEVDSALAVTERFAPADVWDAISEEIAEPQPITGDPLPAQVSILRRWLAPVAVAAAFVLVAGTAVVQSVRLGDANDEVAALSDQLAQPVAAASAAALADPSAQRVVLGSEVSGANAIIVLMPDGTGYVAEHTLQPLSADRTYQLWAIVDGKVISAGILGPDPGVVPFRIDAQGFEGFAITEEVLGGVESSQNDAVVAWLAA